MHRTKTQIPTLAIIGLGFWGEKLLHTCRALKIPLVIYDMDKKRVTQIKKQYPDISIAATADDIFTDIAVDACIIATPPFTHYLLAKQALTHKKHILIEKPMTQNANEAKHLVNIAKKNRRIIMVDHIYLFSPVVHTVKRLIQQDTIGKIRQLVSVRGTGRMHPGSSVLWDLAPHDIAIAAFLLDNNPLRARALPNGQLHSKQPADAIYLLSYPGSIVLQGQVSWTTPVKKRSLEIIGEKGAITVEWQEGTEMLTVYKAAMRMGQLYYTRRKQQILTPVNTPMRRMLEHFISHISRGTNPIPDGAHAQKNIQIITALHRSLMQNGATIRL